MNHFDPKFSSSPVSFDVQSRLTALSKVIIPIHPFEKLSERNELQVLFPQYLAMSQAFPHIQAASQKEGVFDSISRNQEIPIGMQLTSVVGNFLCWDETGGHSAVLQEGNAGLPSILQTDRFHSSLLRSDAERVIGEKLTADYSPSTKRYLTSLYQGLSSLNPITRCAYMVAFEMHAGRMIESLWSAVTRISGLEKDELEYFRAHVGGDDPAEQYHEEMTRRLISMIVSEAQVNEFLVEFERAYRGNASWCDEILMHKGASLGFEKVWHAGSCHCGGVQFRVTAPADVDVLRCNCSICERSGYLHLLASADEFQLLAGRELLSNYRFNTGVAQHLFCKMCGVKSFYRPRSDPNGYSVNLNCLDKSTVASVRVTEFDGKDWEISVQSLQ